MYFIYFWEFFLWKFPLIFQMFWKFSNFRHFLRFPLIFSWLWLECEWNELLYRVQSRVKIPHFAYSSAQNKDRSIVNDKRNLSLDHLKYVMTGHLDQQFLIYLLCAFFLWNHAGIEIAIGNRTLSDKKCYMSGTQVSKQDILPCTLSLSIICYKSCKLKLT